MVTQLCGPCSDTSTEAEFTVRDEACPVMVFKTLAKRVSVHKSSDYKSKFSKSSPNQTESTYSGCLFLFVENDELAARFTKHDAFQHTIGTSVVQFTTRVTLGNINLGEVASTSYLNVFGGLNKVNTFQCSFREGSSATTRFGAVSNFNTFGITDSSRLCCRYL